MLEIRRPEIHWLNSAGTCTNIELCSLCNLSMVLFFNELIYVNFVLLYAWLLVVGLWRIRENLAKR